MGSGVTGSWGLVSGLERCLEVDEGNVWMVMDGLP